MLQCDEEDIGTSILQFLDSSWSYARKILPISARTTTAPPRTTDTATTRGDLQLALVHKREQIELQLAEEVAAAQAYDTILTTNIRVTASFRRGRRAWSYGPAPAGVSTVRILLEEGASTKQGLAWQDRGKKLSVASCGYYVLQHEEMRARYHKRWNAFAILVGERTKKKLGDQAMALEVVTAQKEAEALVFECFMTAGMKHDGSVMLGHIGHISYSHVAVETILQDSGFELYIDHLVRFYKEQKISVLCAASNDTKFKSCLKRDTNDYGDRQVRFIGPSDWVTFAKIVEETRTGPFIETYLHRLVGATAARFVVDEWKFRHARTLDDTGAAESHRCHTETLLKALAILGARVSTVFLAECMVNSEALIRKQAGGNVLLADKWARLAREAWDLAKYTT